MRDVASSDHVGWVLDCGFQEINMTDGSLLFSWTALDHIDVLDSTVEFDRFPHVFGSARTHREAFDFFHLNSVDKDSDGDYLISARHTDAIYKISGRDGSIMWQLGGSASSFVGDGNAFHRQHDARLVFRNATHAKVTLFNNAADGYYIFQTESEGLEILLAYETMTATVKKRFKAPTSDGLLGFGMGSFQSRDAENEYIMCFGSNASIVSYDSSGNLLRQASFDDRYFLYRASIHNWVGRPRRAPDIWTYARTRSSPVHIYASWNGATETAFWNFYATNSSGSYQFLGTKQKDGFETNFTCDRCFGEHFIAEAVEHGGERRNSSSSSPFIPPERLASKCSDTNCFASYVYHTSSRGSTSLRGNSPNITSLGRNLSLVCIGSPQTHIDLMAKVIGVILIVTLIFIKSR
jgi:hypothetical protein